MAPEYIIIGYLQEIEHILLMYTCTSTVTDILKQCMRMYVFEEFCCLTQTFEIQVNVVQRHTDSVKSLYRRFFDYGLHHGISYK